jgi:hypothetical protein
MIRCVLFVRSGIVYIPVAAKTEAGFYMDIEPVEVAPVSDTEAFRKAIMQTIARGHPIIPTPSREAGFPKPVVPQYAKVKSWKTFEKGATYWTFNEKDGAYHIEQWQKRDKGGWLPDPERREVLPTATTLDQAFQRLIDRIRKAEA